MIASNTGLLFDPTQSFKYVPSVSTAQDGVLAKWNKEREKEREAAKGKVCQNKCAACARKNAA